MTQLTKLPETPERTQQELRLQIALAFSLLCTVGYGAAETGMAMARARELCESLGDHALLYPVRVGLWTYYCTTGNLTVARETAHQLIGIAYSHNEPIMQVAAHALLGITLHHQGELLACRSQFEDSARLYNRADHARYVQWYRVDPGIFAASEMVRTLWLLGYPDQARRQAQQTLALARELVSPLNLAFCYVIVNFFHQLMNEPDDARSIGAACIALCDEHGIEWERAWVSPSYGWAVARLGEVNQGISIIRASLELQHRKGNEVAVPQSQAILAEALWNAGIAGEALEAVEEGLSVSNRTGDIYYDAGLWCLKGQLLETQNSAAAESCFRRAINIAREQAALSLELRAATSLAGLWQKQKKLRDAEQVLDGVLVRFTEGFGTHDVVQARSRLAELRLPRA